MESKQLPQDWVKKMIQLRTDKNKLTMLMGQETIKIEYLKEEVEKSKELIRQYNELYKSMDKSINDELSKIDKDYPDGEVDLDKGVVYYT